MSMKKESPWDVELHLAAARGDAKRLRILLDSGRVHVDCKDKDGTTPLILAAAGGHIDGVTELLHQGADPNAKRLTGTTALFFAAQGGYMDIAGLLLEHGAIVDSCSIDGGTPLFVACQYGHLDVVEGLIERGASPNAHMKDGATALFIAAQNGHLRILEVLLDHGAKTDAARTDGATPLWIASQMGHDHAVRRLLRAGAKVDATRHDGATPLFKAAHKGHTAVIGELLKYRPSLGVLPNGESALHAAALTGHMTVARQLVGAGADPLLVNQEGITPLQLAMRHSQTQVANYLKDKSRGNSSTFGRGFLRDVHLQIAQNKKLKELLEEVGEIRALIHLVVENVSIVKELHGNILSHTNKDMQKELEVRTCTISQTAFHVQRKLRDIGTGITIIDDFTAASAQDGSTYTRIKILQYTTMLQLFSEVMNDYNTSLLKYHDKCLLLLQQQRSLLRRQVTSTELDHLLDTEGASLFVDNILEDSKVARQQLSDIESRHNDVLKLEKSLTEIRDMFAEIAFLIEKQGEQVNNIEYFANKTTNNIDGGRTQLKKAEHKSHTCRKWKIKITIIVIIVIFLLLIIASFNTAR